MFKYLADAYVQGICHHFTHNQGEFIVGVLVVGAIVFILSRIFKS